MKIEVTKLFTPETYTMPQIQPTRSYWRPLSLFTATAVALTPTSPLLASQAMEQLFGLMKAKGSITQAEHDMLLAAMRADEAKAAAATPAVAPAATVSASPGTNAALEQRIAAQDARIKQLEATLNGTKSKVEQIAANTKPAEGIAGKVDKLEDILMGTKGQVEELSRITDNTSPSTMNKADLDELLADKWYERLKMRGYAQFRYHGILDEENGTLHVPNDALANDIQTFGLRRGRVVFSGDVTNHLYLYLQADFFGNLSGTNALQARDYYADISLDSAREWRVRIGQSKVPFGWVNMQSSQNRLALERPDALNSAAEGERDHLRFAIVSKTSSKWDCVAQVTTDSWL
jgi:hypothetical protein